MLSTAEKGPGVANRVKAVLNRVVISSEKQNWETPSKLFAELDAEFHTLHLAANAENRKCPRWLGPGSLIAEDLLTADIGAAEVCWMNPPCSRPLQDKFIAKAAAIAQTGGTVVALLPSRTDTVAFHRYIWDRVLHRPHPGVEMRFLKSRVRFVGGKDSATFPSMVVIFRVQAC